MSEVIARFNENKILFIKNEIIEEIDMPLPTFTRNSVAYLSDGTQVAANVPRFEQGKFGKGVLVEEGTTNIHHENLYHSFSEGSSYFNVTDVERDGFIRCKRFERIAEGNAYFTVDIPCLPNTAYTLTFWIRGVNLSPDSYVNMYLADDTQSHEYLKCDNLTDEFKKFTITRVTSADATKIVRASLHFGTNFIKVGEIIEVADWQLEAKPYPTSFTDGTRAAEELTIPTEGVLNPQEGTWEQWVYVNDVSKRQVPSHFSSVFRIPRAGGGHGILVWHSPSSPNWTLETRDDNNQDTRVIVSDSYTPNGWHLFTTTWKHGGEAVLYIDGIRRGTIGNSRLPSGFTSYAYIGGHSSDSYLNTLHDSVRISSRARTDEEILAAYQSGKPLSVDKYTTYKLDFNDKLNPTKDISSFQFSADGDLYLPEIIEELDMPLPTFTRNSVAYLSDGTQVAANVPRFEQGKFGKAVMVEEGTENLIPTENWVIVSGTLIKEVINNFHLKFTNTIVDNTHVMWAGTAGITINCSAGDKITFSAEYKTNCKVRARIRDRNNNGHIETSEIYIENTNNQWKKYYGTATALVDNPIIWIYLLDYRSESEYGTIEVRNWQLEAKPYPTSFVDGTRAAETLTIPTEGVLNPQEGTVEFWVRAQDLYTRRRDIFETNSGSVADDRIILGYNVTLSGLQLYWKPANATSYSLNIPEINPTTEWVQLGFKYKWNGISGYDLAVIYNGQIVKTGTSANGQMTDFYRVTIGGILTHVCNMLIDNLRISSRARTGEEILAAYQSNKPLPVDKDTTYKLGFDNSLNPNKNINTIQIDKNRILFIPEFEEGVSF